MRIRDNIRGHTRVSRIRISSSRSLSDDSELGSGQGKARQARAGLDCRRCRCCSHTPIFFSFFSVERARSICGSLCNSCLHSSIYSIQWLVLVLSCKALSCLRALFLYLRLRLLGSWYQYCDCAQARPSIHPSVHPIPPFHPIPSNPIVPCSTNLYESPCVVWRGVKFEHLSVNM